MVRVRHYTKASNRVEIIAEGRVVARAQNKVFVEYASRKPMSANDAREAYLLTPGKATAYVEFDADPDEIGSQTNKLDGYTEYFIVGDVDLTNRNPVGFRND